MLVYISRSAENWVFSDQNSEFAENEDNFMMEYNFLTIIL